MKQETERMLAVLLSQKDIREEEQEQCLAFLRYLFQTGALSELKEEGPVLEKVMEVLR